MLALGVRRLAMLIFRFRVVAPDYGGHVSPVNGADIVIHRANLVIHPEPIVIRRGFSMWRHAVQLSLKAGHLVIHRDG